MNKEMTSQERVKTAISRKIPDHIPIHDEVWQATLRRWYKQGFPKGISPGEYFGYDIVAISFYLGSTLPAKIIEETDDYVISIVSTGAVQKRYKNLQTVQIMDCPIKKKDDWIPIRETLRPHRKRINWATAWQTYQQARQRGQYVAFKGFTGYNLLIYYVKNQELLVFMAEDADWVKEMVDTTSDLFLETVKMMYREGFHFDGVWVINDIGYKNSSIISPQMYKEIISPSDKKRNDWFHEQGMQTIVHSCGNVKELMPLFIENGFDCFEPLEVKAGMDLRELKPRYGNQIAFMGGIDVTLMEDPDDTKIENEIKEKFEIAKQGGGYIYHSDHSIPLDVSFRKYQFIVECVKKYGEY